MSAPLEGIRVVEFSRVLAGPWCGMTLADLGADVIKVEPPSGDDTRGYGPPFRDGLSAYFACCNRNKRSLALDLGAPASRPVLEALVRGADVLIQNWRAGSEHKFGVDYESVAALNPQVIYCAITGYGQDGPGRERPGYDFVVQAEAGLMSITGAGGDEPSKVGVAVADLVTGMNASIAILAALQARQTTGRGQFLDISLFDSQLQGLANVASNVLFTGDDAARYGNAHASIVPYQVFHALDGEFALAVASEKLWLRLCTVLDRPEWSDDARYRDNAARVVHRATVVAELEHVFGTDDRDAWLRRLRDAGIPCAPINGVRAALEDPMVAARGMRIELDGVPMLGSPLKLSDTPVQYRRAPPRLGQHNDEILRELGLL